MLTPILLALAASPLTAALPAPSAHLFAPAPQSGFSERYAAAKDDVAALWELY